MTRFERYRNQLKELEAKRGMLMRTGNYLKAANLHKDIQKVEELIREAEAYEEANKPKPIQEIASREEIDKMGIIPLMIECHLIADLLVEISYSIVDICKDHGFDDVQLMPDLREIIKKSEKFASFLTGMSPELCDLLVRNDTLNQSLHKKYVRYIEQRLGKKSTKGQ